MHIYYCVCVCVCIIVCTLYLHICIYYCVYVTLTRMCAVAALDVPAHDGVLPLFAAAAENNIEIAELMLAHPASKEPFVH